MIVTEDDIADEIRIDINPLLNRPHPRLSNNNNINWGVRSSGSSSYLASSSAYGPTYGSMGYSSRGISPKIASRIPSRVFSGSSQGSVI